MRHDDPGECYEVHAVRYANMPRRRRDNFMSADDHDGPMPMDFFVWLLKSPKRTILVDTGFTAQTAERRQRKLLRCPIDALRTLSTNPFKYLIAPRLIAAVLMLPVLVGIADIIGVFGGYLVSVFKLDFSPSIYLKNTVDFVETIDIVSGLVKAAAFGFIVALMGTYNGFESRGGAQGVGKATTDAVVGASILILAANFIITGIFFSR